MQIDSELLQKTIEGLAWEDGVKHLLQIPGVWECVSEYYNNDAITRIEQENDD